MSVPDSVLARVLPPLPPTPGDNWRADALCAEMDPELWFPEFGKHGLAARRICNRCPVRMECLAEALADEPGAGIFGGTSLRQRDDIRFGRITLEVLEKLELS